MGCHYTKPFLFHLSTLNLLSLLLDKNVNNHFFRQHLVERWKEEVFSTIQIYQKTKEGYFMKSLLPFVRYFVPVPLFYFWGLNLLSASLRYSHKPSWTQSQAQVTAILQLLWTLFILFGHPRNGKTRTTILSIPFSYRSARIF